MKKMKRSLSQDRHLKLIDSDSRACSSLLHQLHGERGLISGYLLNKQLHSGILETLIQHGDLDQDQVKKLGKSRNLLVCSECLVTARRDEDGVYKHLLALSEGLNTVDYCDGELLKLVDTVFVKLAKIVSHRFQDDTSMEHFSVKSLNDIKMKSQPLDFLMHKQRCTVVIACLAALSGVDMTIKMAEIQTLSRLKVNNLCLAYESLMGLANSNLTTAPSIARNLKLLKTVHSKVLLTEIGYPTGGSYTLLQNLSTALLPELKAPQAGDFVSADDNIQVSYKIIIFIVHALIAF